MKNHTEGVGTSITTDAKSKLSWGLQGRGQKLYPYYTCIHDENLQWRKLRQALDDMESILFVDTYGFYSRRVCDVQLVLVCQVRDR
jgi:hypothetical protein